MIKLEIKIKEESIQDFDKIKATALNVTMKEKAKKLTKAETEALNYYKRKMGFDNNLLVVNKCQNETEFEKVKNDIITSNI